MANEDLVQSAGVSETEAPTSRLHSGPGSVLVTGASSGIGRATAQMLAAAGFQVFAGVRRPSGLAGIHEVELDVTSAMSIEKACKIVGAEVGEGGLQGLVNNAGVGEVWPMECIPMDRLRAVFEVDVFGIVGVTQAFLPILRTGRGRIVNIGSVGGFLTIPFGASLTAAKHAVESLSDAFRMELYPCGIPVTCLQPASINSGSAEKLGERLRADMATLAPESASRYGEALERFRQVMIRSESGGSPPEVVARAVLEILQSPNPPARRVVGKHGRLLWAIGHLIPSAMRDGLLRRVFGG